MRIGAKKRPFYRVVVVEERSKRTGGYVELLGTYNPLTEPKEIKLKQDRIDYWIKMGAQPSVGYLRIIGKAPQRVPRKPKKEKKEEAPAPTVTPSDTPAPETPTEPKTEETPKEEQKESTPAMAEQPTQESTTQEEKKDEGSA